MRHLALALLVVGCAEPQQDLLTTSFVDPEDVSRISMFRSCCGHDYSGRGETNRSMKHYIHPLESFGVTNDAMPIYAPFDAKVTRIVDDTRELPCFDDVHGQQIYLRPEAQPGVYIKLFHVNPLVEKGQRVEAGEQIAWADVRECDASDRSQVSAYPSSFDIALERADNPFPVFTHLTEEAWARWAEADALTTPEDTVIPAEVRNAAPCTDYWQECADGMIGLWGHDAYPPWW